VPAWGGSRRWQRAARPFVEVHHARAAHIGGRLVHPIFPDATTRGSPRLLLVLLERVALISATVPAAVAVAHERIGDRSAVQRDAAEHAPITSVDGDRRVFFEPQSALDQRAQVLGGLLAAVGVALGRLNANQANRDALTLPFRVLRLTSRTPSTTRTNPGLLSVRGQGHGATRADVARLRWLVGEAPGDYDEDEANDKANEDAPQRHTYWVPGEDPR
jgi:hypothetical protein